MDKRIKTLIDKLAEHNFTVTYCLCETYSRKGKIETVHFFEKVDENGAITDKFEETNVQKAVDRLVHNLACLRSADNGYI